MKNLSTKGKIWQAAIKVVLDWYCHDNNPAPAWWRTTGPYNEILKALGV